VPGVDRAGLVLPLMDGTSVRLADAQAAAARLFTTASRAQPDGVATDEAEEMLRLLGRLETQARPIRPQDRIRDGADGQIMFLNLVLDLAKQLQQTLTVTCTQCGRELSTNSHDTQLHLTTDGEPVFYCLDCRPGANHPNSTQAAP